MSAQPAHHAIRYDIIVVGASAGGVEALIRRLLVPAPAESRAGQRH